jgi:hypothetical protein
MLAKPFDILDQVPGGVVIKRCMRPALPGATLVKQNYAISLRVKEAPIIGIQAGAWSSMKKHYGLPIRIAALLVIKFMNRRDSKVAALVRFDRVIESS